MLFRESQRRVGLVDLTSSLDSGTFFFCRAMTLQFASVSEIIGGSVLVEQWYFPIRDWGQAAVTAGLEAMPLPSGDHGGYSG